MGINRKISAAITATMLLALNVSSSPPATAIFRPRCTENNRGIGDVSATSSRNSVALWWEAPGYSFQSIYVCYKKNWGLEGKCDAGYHSETYGSPVSWGQIIISGLDSNSCYKFAVYGVDAGNRLIGQKKIRTTR
jgi:hypothetical protein